jgi:chemotaxis methyl-accepting protein methylase
MTHKCQICKEDLDEHSLEEAQLCYYKSKLPTQRDEEVE